MSSLAGKEKANVFNFLRDASHLATLALINAKVEGRAPKEPHGSDDAEESEDEDEEDGAGKRRHLSTTLMGLLEMYFDACPQTSTHHPCMVVFIKESMRPRRV
jgi:hypothetical protein